MQKLVPAERMWIVTHWAFAWLEWRDWVGWSICDCHEFWVGTKCHNGRRGTGLVLWDEEVGGSSQCSSQQCQCTHPLHRLVSSGRCRQVWAHQHIHRLTAAIGFGTQSILSRGQIHSNLPKPSVWCGLSGSQLASLEPLIIMVGLSFGIRMCKFSLIPSLALSQSPRIICYKYQSPPFKSSEKQVC